MNNTDHRLSTLQYSAGKPWIHVETDPKNKAPMTLALQQNSVITATPETFWNGPGNMTKSSRIKCDWASMRRVDPLREKCRCHEGVYMVLYNIRVGFMGQRTSALVHPPSRTLDYSNDKCHSLDQSVILMLCLISVCYQLASIYLQKLQSN